MGNAGCPCPLGKPRGLRRIAPVTSEPTFGAIRDTGRCDPRVWATLSRTLSSPPWLCKLWCGDRWRQSPHHSLPVTFRPEHPCCRPGRVPGECSGPAALPLHQGSAVATSLCSKQGRGACCSSYLGRCWQGQRAQVSPSVPCTPFLGPLESLSRRTRRLPLSSICRPMTPSHGTPPPIWNPAWLAWLLFLGPLRRDVVASLEGSGEKFR